MKTRQIFGKKRWGDLPIALLFLLPSILLFAIFHFYPMLAAIRLSFYKWDNLSVAPAFSGFANYIKLLSDDRFWTSLRVTFTYTVGVTAVSIVLGLVLAVALNHRSLAFRSFWRILYFLPTVTPTVAAAMVWILLFNPNFGYVNTFLGYLHIQRQTWLSDVNLALPTLMTLGIWRRVGFTVIIYLAALQAIPQEYYESARVDGAGVWQTFFRITVPLVAPTTIMLVTLGLIDSFLVFDQVLVMTRGGPADATLVIGVFLYTSAFSFFKMGSGAAISVVTLLIVATITILQWRFVSFGTSEMEAV
ncbi:MAG: ABC transporter permease [Anaerolinea sp.]|nr:ABC transporter permease [Anaerolinea sp.]